jgi:hypothetical protein
MTNDRPITPEQAMLAVKAAGLDPDKSLNEQLQGSGDLERQVTELSEQVKGLSGVRAVPTDPHARERQFAENLRDALNKNLTPWFGQDEEHDDAA